MRGLFRTLIASTAVVAVAACSDSATNPSAPARSLAPANRPSLDVDASLLFNGTRTSTFTVTSTGGSWSIGNGLFTIDFPANSVCDPSIATNGYGIGTWDNACVPLAPGKSLTLTARYGITWKGPVLDVSPAIRFSPSTNVRLTSAAYAPVIRLFSGYFAANPDALRWFGIYYTPDFGTTAITDAASDQSLRTYISLSTGLAWRRVKHFSGYVLPSGEPCDPSQGDPNCRDDGGPIMQR